MWVRWDSIWLSTYVCKSKQAIHVAKSKEGKLIFILLSAYVCFRLTPLYDEGTKCSVSLQHFWHHFWEGRWPSPHTKNLQCEILHICMGPSGDRGAQSACARTETSQKVCVRRIELRVRHMGARCTSVGLKKHAYVAHGREWKIWMDFSQFNLELAGWQVGLGRLVHLLDNPKIKLS